MGSAKGNSKAAVGFLVSTGQNLICCMAWHGAWMVPTWERGWGALAWTCPCWCYLLLASLHWAMLIFTTVNCCSVLGSPQPYWCQGSPICVWDSCSAKVFVPHRWVWHTSGYSGCPWKWSFWLTTRRRQQLTTIDPWVDGWKLTLPATLCPTLIWRNKVFQTQMWHLLPWALIAALLSRLHWYRNW